MSMTNRCEKKRTAAPSSQSEPQEPLVLSQSELGALPLPIGLVFERDPFEGARTALLQATRRSARIGAASEAEALAREATAVELAMLATSDDEVRTAGSHFRIGSLGLLAEAPANSVTDVACKLAVLVREMVTGRDGSPFASVYFALVASSLADLVLLRAGPIVLPAGVELPITTAENVRRWRDVAASFTASDEPSQ
jgi:hypothetical protein